MAITLNGTTGITTPAIDNQGDLTVDTNTLVVDSANNNVGIGTSSPGARLDVEGAAASNNLAIKINNTDTSGYSTLQMGGTDAGIYRNGSAQSSYGGNSSLNLITVGAHPISFSTSNTPRVTIDSTGAVTMPYQTAFLVRPSTSQTNFAPSANVTAVWGSEIFDQNSDFSSNTFTAPVTGRYLLTVNLALRDVDSAASYIQSVLVTSNRGYELLWSGNGLAQDVQYWYQSFSAFTDMDAGDTSYVYVRQQGGTQQLTFATDSSFAGYLVC